MRRYANKSMPVCLFALFFGAASANSSVTLELKPHALIERDAVRLADIVEVQTSDAALRQTLSDIQLNEASTLSVRRLGRGAIATLIKRETAKPISIDWRGAEHVVVERRMQTVDAESLIAAAREQLTQALRNADPELTRIDVRAADKLESIRVPSGAMTIAVKPVRTSAPSKRMCVWLDIAVDGKVRRHVPVWLAVGALKPVRVTARSLAVRDAVSVDDLIVEERDIADVIGKPLPLSADVQGSRTRRALAVGALVYADDVEARPAVLRNEEVRVQVASGSVVLETSAVAEQEGNVGQQIRLRNPSSDESYLGRVVGVGKVHVSVR